MNAFYFIKKKRKIIDHTGAGVEERVIEFLAFFASSSFL
jgi:hypothetical protein